MRQGGLLTGVLAWTLVLIAAAQHADVNNVADLDLETLGWAGDDVGLETRAIDFFKKTKDGRDENDWACSVDHCKYRYRKPGEKSVSS